MSTEVTVVRVVVRPEQGGFFAHSPDVWGLRVWGASFDELCDRVRDGIKLLFRLNNKREVEVQLAPPPGTFERPTFSYASTFIVQAAA